MAAGNSINESTTGVVGFTGTAFTGTPLTQYLVNIGAANSYDIAQVAGTGSSGDVLTSNGATAAPTWQASAGGGGAWVYLTQSTASASAAIEFNSTYITTTYDTYAIVIETCKPVTDNTGLQMLVSNDNGSTYQVTNYASNGVRLAASPSDDASSVRFSLTDNTVGNATNEYCSLTIFVTGLAAAGSKTTLWGFGYQTSATGATQGVSCGGIYSVAETDNAIQFSFESGNISTGTFKLYGIKDS